MDHQYGIAVTNKFSLFIDEEEDPSEILSRTEELVKSKKKEEGEKKPTKTSKQKKNAVADTKAKVVEHPAVKKEERPPSTRGDRGGDRGRGGINRNREPREIRDNDGDRRPPRRQGPKEIRETRVGDENVPPEFREQPESGFRRWDDREGFGGERGRGRGGRGRGRGARGGERGGFAGQRGGFGFNGERKREFDRHSGNDRTEQTGAAESNEWANQPEVNAETPEVNDSAENVQQQQPEEEAQPHEMTLDEWKELRNQNKPKATFNIRQAGEGEDGAKWSSGREYHKKHEGDEDEDEEDEDEDEEDEDDHHSRGKHLVTDIRITFNDNPRRGRGRRGGRGGLERGGSRGGMRGVGSKPRESAAPRFDDEVDFPSLVKSAA
ncbi:hypothetical protein BsWGS_02756 [Bradybaena similaris]